MTATVTVLIPESTRGRVLDEDAMRRLAAIARTRVPDGDAARWDVGALLDGACACLTGWGTPPIDAAALARAPGLCLVAHTAGSIRRLLPLDAVGSRVRVSHAAGVIADAVAEFVLLQALLALRRPDALDRGMREGCAWHDLRERWPGRLLACRTVGVVGAGYVGRAVIRALTALGCRVLVSDPRLSAEDAGRLGVHRRGLDRLLETSEVVSLHAPVLPETTGMIGARELALLPDGAVLINTARAALVDEEALLDALRRRPILAVLDVFGEEPLPRDSPLRSLDNVVLSPHSAGHTVDTHRRQGSTMVDEVDRFLRGAPLRHEIDRAQLASMA